MDSKVSRLQAIRMILVKKNLKEMKANKLKAKFLSILKSNLIKNKRKMPLIKKKSESLKLQRIWSPTKLHDLKQRLISPGKFKSRKLRLKMRENTTPKLSPIWKNQMFIKLNNDQSQLINRISNKISNQIAETKSFQYQGFISPRVLARKYLHETGSLSQRNEDIFNIISKQQTIDNFLPSENYREFTF